MVAGSNPAGIANVFNSLSMISFPESLGSPRLLVLNSFLRRLLPTRYQKGIASMNLHHGSKRTPLILIWVGVVALMAAGCTTGPANYSAKLSMNDPKWRSAECQEIRAEAANYKEQKVSYAAGALLGPYGLALAAAGKEHQEKKRRQLARDMHMRCSSEPLPRELAKDPMAKPKSNSPSERVTAA
jgi:hypothetical protein